MKIRLCIPFLMAAVYAAQAQTLSDDFDRENTTQTAYTANVGGTGWTQEDDGGATGDDWFINSGALRLRNRSADAILYNTGLETQNGIGTGFILKADVAGLQLGTYSGIIFNYTDEDNYYVVRFRAGFSTYQVLQRNGTGWDVLLNTDLPSGTFTEDADYTVTVRSDAAGVFDVTIDETGVGNVVNSVRVDDSASALTGGYAGLYGNISPPNHAAQFDNFELEIFEVTDVLFDDFNRTNTTQTAYTVNVDGTGWTQLGDGESGVGNDWFVNSEALRLRNRITGNSILYNTGLETQSGNGTNFVLSADAMGLVEGAYVGVIFNYIDENNYYVLRFRAGYGTYQILRQTGSGWTVFVNTSLSSGTFAEDTYYTTTIASDAAGIFDCSIEETGTDNVLVSTNVDDSASALLGGYAGVYGSAGTTTHIGKYDNSRLTYFDPVPTYIGPVSMTQDGSDLVFGWQGDADGTYVLQSRASLMTGDWVNVENIGGFDGTMYATNDTSASSSFFRIILQ